jgi:O-antigen ligase
VGGAGRPRRWLFLLFFVVAGLLCLTKSRTSVAAFLIALSVVGILKAARRGTLRLFSAALCFAAAAAILLMLLGIDLTGRLNDTLLMGRPDAADSLNGRIPMWTEVLRFIDQRPWLGYGYGAFWTPQHVQDVSLDCGFRVAVAHSSWLETAAALGWVGAATLLAVLAAGIARATVLYWKTLDAGIGFMLALLVFTLVGSLTEACLIDLRLVGFLTVCGLARLAFCESPVPLAAGARPVLSGVFPAPAGLIPGAKHGTC